MVKQTYRIERDSLGEIKVPSNALYGAQTERARQNFPISGIGMPRPFIRALGMIKGAAAAANRELDLLDPSSSKAIVAAAAEVEEGIHDGHFPVDIFQTGSGTSTNMNANEVIARLASTRSGNRVHPNDHVNLGQSSNDVIPTAIHVAACLEIESRLLPALSHLAGTIRKRAEESRDQVKTGRTHLMDAMPVRLRQEMGGWAAQIEGGRERVEASLPRLRRLALGGTAVGTGVNVHPGFAAKVVGRLKKRTGIDFLCAADYFEALSSQDSAVETSGQLRVIAVGLMKISNDLRWMNSGPLAGLGEIVLPEFQPGSSIMPGKVNPVIPEAVAMVCAQVMGNDATIGIAGQSGNFQLNTMLPVIAGNLLQSINLLSNAIPLLADRAIAGFVVNADHLHRSLTRNPILVTSLNPIIGYEKGTEIARRAREKNRPLLEVAEEMTDLSRDELKKLLDPDRLTRGGL
jgi:fumarate hydratase, class II